MPLIADFLPLIAVHAVHAVMSQRHVDVGLDLSKEWQFLALIQGHLQQPGTCSQV